MAVVEEIVAVILLNDDCTYINGHNLIDGGLSWQMAKS